MNKYWIVLMAFSGSYVSNNGFAWQPGDLRSLAADENPIFPNKTLQLTIRDFGPGIPASELEKIWEPFYTTKEGGTGLGLAITKKLVEDNGGQLSLRNDGGVVAEVVFGRISLKP